MGRLRHDCSQETPLNVTLFNVPSAVKRAGRTPGCSGFAYAYFEMSFFMMDMAPPLYPPPKMAKWLRW